MSVIKKHNEVYKLHQEEMRELNEEKILANCKNYFKENGNLAVPQDYVCNDAEDGKPFRFGRAIERVKKFVKGDSNYIFHEDFIYKLLEIDPRIFEEKYSQILAREQKEKKLLKYFGQYFEKNKNLAVSARYVHKDEETGETYNLGKELCCIKEYRKHIGKRFYSKEFMDELQKMDERVFDAYYPRDLKGRSY